MKVLRYVLVAMFAVGALAACSSDDSSDSGSNDTSGASDGGSDSGDGGSDGGSDVSVDVDGVGATTGGSGTISLAGDEHEFSVDACVTTEGALTVAGTTDDGATVALTSEGGADVITYTSASGEVWAAEGADVTVDGNSLKGSGEADVVSTSGVTTEEISVEVDCS